jgi:hypothetical protein
MRAEPFFAATAGVSHIVVILILVLFPLSERYLEDVHIKYYRIYCKLAVP